MIILDEKNYAEECLRVGMQNQKPYRILMILAKYYYHYLGYRKKRIISCLTQYMETYYPVYRIKKELWGETIERIANRAKKYPLYQNDGVHIYQTELDRISALNNEVLERVAFTLLCIAKLNYVRNAETNGWVNTQEKEIFEIAGVNCTCGERSDYIGDLRIAGIVEFAKKNTNLSLRITFLCQDGEDVAFISDFRALGNEYMKIKGGNYIRCKSCGLLIRGNKNGTKKYCDACKGHPATNSKIIYCNDCGKRIAIDTKNNKTCRCNKCYEAYRRNYYKENKRKLRKSNYLSTEQTEDETL